MKFRIFIVIAFALGPAMTVNAFAEGDAEAGRSLFKKCAACHSVVNRAGDVIVKGGKIGPNLYNVVGRQAGAVDGFKYSTPLTELGDTGFVWDEAQVADWVADPSKYLKKVLGKKAKSKMVFKLKEGGADVAAYLASIGQN
jgi:cytochrome c